MLAIVAKSTKSNQSRVYLFSESFMTEAKRNGPWLEVAHEEWILQVLVGDEPLGGFVDIQVVGPNQTLVGSAASPSAVVDVMTSYRVSGECLSGRYFWTKNLILVDPLDELTVFAVLRDLLDSGEAWSALEIVVS